MIVSIVQSFLFVYHIRDILNNLILRFKSWPKLFVSHSSHSRLQSNHSLLHPWTGHLSVYSSRYNHRSSLNLNTKMKHKSIINKWRTINNNKNIKIWVSVLSIFFWKYSYITSPIERSLRIYFWKLSIIV